MDPVGTHAVCTGACPQVPEDAPRAKVRRTDPALQLEAPHFKSQTRNRDGIPCVRSVEDQSFTVCASHTRIVPSSSCPPQTTQPPVGS